MFEKLNEEDARRTDIGRKCAHCHSEAMDDPLRGPLVLCDTEYLAAEHLEHALSK